MVTKTFPAGAYLPEYVDDDGVFDLFEAQDAIFSCNYLGGSTKDYPVRIRDASSPFTWQNGLFLGNIPESVWRKDIYPAWNNAQIFIQNGRAGVIQDVNFGVRDNFDTGCIDGIRMVGAGAVRVSRCFAWCIRDDFIEADTTDNDLIVEDCFVEGAYGLISHTNTTSAKQITIQRTMMGMKPYRNDRPANEVTHGHPFKSAGSSATYYVNDFDLAISPRWLWLSENQNSVYGQAINALNRTTVGPQGARCYVLGGTLDRSDVAAAFVNAGYQLIQDGVGSAATNAWNAKKEIFLGDVTPPPVDPEPAQGISALNFQITVGA